MKTIWRLSLVLFLLTACNSIANQRKVKEEDYVFQIDSKEVFEMLKGKPLSDKYGQVESVKIIYVLAEQKTYFIHSSRFRFHFEFCESKFNYTQGLGNFNATNYSDHPQKKYVLANLNYFTAQDKYVLELAAEDVSSSAQIQALYDHVRGHFFDSEKLYFLTQSEYLQSFEVNRKIDVKAISADQLFAGQNFQSISQGKAIGYLHWITNKEELKNIGLDDIAVLSISPNEINLCKGIITTSFQTPLSHISILSQNRNTPSCAVRNFIKQTENLKWKDKLVSFTVTANDYSIREATENERKQFLQERKTHKRIPLRFDLKEKNILPIKKITSRSKVFCGAKAANLGELNRLQQAEEYSKFYIPESAYAIPFYYYAQHIQSPQIKQAIDSLLTDSVFQTSIENRNSQLKHIRKLIQGAPLDKTLLFSIQQIIDAASFNSWRFRSSTNAEDEKGFNGAGLYVSKSAKKNDPKKSIEKALKSVWASVWTERAFMEREIFGMDQRTVYMGVLMHRAFEHEDANGVAITKNIYREEFTGYTVNVQKGEESVVAPKENVRCDQFVFYPASKIDLQSNKMVVDYITSSSLSQPNHVLTSDQLIRLYDALEAIEMHFMGTQLFSEEKEHLSWDIEFKFEKDKLYIKQVRPFK